MARCPAFNTNNVCGRIMRLAIILAANFAMLFAVRNADAGFQWNPPKNPPTNQRSDSGNPGTATTISPRQDQRIRQDAKALSSETGQSGRATNRPLPRRESPQQQRHGQSGMPTNITSQPGNTDLSQDMITRERLDPGVPDTGQTGAGQAGQQHSRETSVQGFGKQIPLALALRQIVPASYAYSFGDNVNHKTPISWEGGQDWRTTLRLALKAKGLAMQVQNGVVRITQVDRHTAWQSPQNLNTKAHASSSRGRLTRPGSQQNQDRTANAYSNSSSNTGMRLYNGNHRQESRGASKSMAPVSVPTRLPDGTANAVPETNTQQGISDDTRSHQSQGKGSSIRFARKTAKQSHVLSKKYNFDADSGDSLRTTLQNWSQKAGVELRWEPAYDFRVQESIETKGDFAQAVTQVLAQYKMSAPRPHGRLHTTSESGKPVLIVE